MAGGIGLFGEAEFAEDITLADILGIDDDVFGEMRWDEGETGAGAEDDIAGQDSGVPDPDRDVDADEGDFGDRGWVDPAAEDGEIGEFIDPLIVADTAVDHDAGAGAGAGGGGEVVADERAVVDLAEEIDNQNIALLKRVDDPGVLAAGSPFSGADRLDDVMQIGAVRHHHRGDDATGEREFWVKIEPVALKHPVIAVRALQDVIGLVVGDEFHPLDDIVPDPWATVLSPLAGPTRGEGGDALRAIEDHSVESFLPVIEYSMDSSGRHCARIATIAPVDVAEGGVNVSS